MRCKWQSITSERFGLGSTSKVYRTYKYTHHEESESRSIDYPMPHLLTGEVELNPTFEPLALQLFIRDIQTCPPKVSEIYTLARANALMLGFNIYSTSLYLFCQIYLQR